MTPLATPADVATATIGAETDVRVAGQSPSETESLGETAMRLRLSHGGSRRDILARATPRLCLSLETVAVGPSAADGRRLTAPRPPAGTLDGP